jgi:hypothetical protein
MAQVNRQKVYGRLRFSLSRSSNLSQRIYRDPVHNIIPLRDDTS